MSLSAVIHRLYSTKGGIMHKNYIIHLSDFHINSKNIGNIKEICPRLIDDIKKNCAEGDIALVVCSGDLVYSGSSENFSLAFDNFIEPILSGLNIKESQFIYVPGNHEVDISKVDKDFSESFTHRILTEGLKLEDLKKPNVNDRLSSFFEFSSLFYEWEQSKLVVSRQELIGNVKYGITMVNSSWNTAGDSNNEAKKIIIPREALIESLSAVAECDKKIIVMHHPIDWFFDENAAEIEGVLNKYDFVLTGHKHYESVNLMKGMNGITLYNAASKVDISANENGYTIISFDDSSEVLINNRSYNKNRLTYVPNTNISEDGKLTFVLEKNSIQQLCCDIILNTKNSFFKELSSLFIINLLDNSVKKSFDELFVIPKIEKKSEQAKERYDDPDSKYVFNIQDLFVDNNDVTFWGKKEAGKTIFANYIAKTMYENYNSIKKLPIVLDCKFISSYKTAIEKSAVDKVIDLIADNKSITKKDIVALLENGRVVIILDNFDRLNKSDILVEAFKSKYPGVKLIYFRTEIPAVFSDEDKASLHEKYSGTIHNYFIRSMDKHSIRLLAQNVSELNPNIEDGYIDKIIYSFSVNNMPRTPFAVSMILSICNETSNYLPTNQAKIVQAFMEKLLEKLNPEEVLSKTFNFDNKERFLANLAYYLFCKKTYSLSKDDFVSFTQEYHRKKGYSLKDSRFDIIFFDKGILVEYNDFVFFRYECLNDYYLAKYCELNRNVLFDKILANNMYLNYAEVVCYYAGMVLDDVDLIRKVSEYILPYLQSHSDLGNLFEIDSIKLVFDVPDDDIKTRLINTKQLSTEEKDNITDVPDKSGNYTPVKYKAEVQYNENISFALSVDILGHIFKNSDEVDNEIKKHTLDIFIKSCLILWKQFRESLLSFASKLNDEIMAKETEKDSKSKKEEIEKAYDDFCDILKLSVPLGISSFIFECIGTEKMRLIFDEYYNIQEYSSPEKLLLLMLLCDLKVKGWDIKLRDYINKVGKKDFLWVVFFKCQYCYQFNYFGKETQKIIEPMADCLIKLKNANKRSKAKLMNDIMQREKLIKDLK